MNIQSLSIVVPTGQCWNNCPYCVSRMHCEDYGDYNSKFSTDIINTGYIRRIMFVRDQGCNTMMITGTAEPQQNMNFIKCLLVTNNSLRQPFYNVEIQTTGSGMNKDTIKELAELGVTTLALSISSLDVEQNQEIIHMPEKKKNNYYDLIKFAHDVGMNVRACLNLTSNFKWIPKVYMFFDWANNYKIEQLTFRQIYKSNTPCEQNEWIENHYYPGHLIADIVNYIKTNGTPIARLPFGYIQYSVNGISTVVDDNCMSKDEIDNFKYMILRPNGRLYSRWDDKGSLVF